MFVSLLSQVDRKASTRILRLAVSVFDHVRAEKTPGQQRWLQWRRAFLVQVRRALWEQCSGRVAIPPLWERLCGTWMPRKWPVHRRLSNAWGSEEGMHGWGTWTVTVRSG